MVMEPKMFSISIRTIMLFRGLYTLLRKEIRNSKYLKQIGNEDHFSRYFRSLLLEENGEKQVDC